MTVSHTRGDLYRAVLEATAFGVRHNVEAMAAAGVEITRVLAVGGGTQGGLWTQVVSDVTGLEQVLRRTGVGASYGAAWLAACLLDDALDAATDIDSWNPAADVVRPDPRTRDRYDALYAQYRALYPATREISHSLAALQHDLARTDPPSAP